MTQLSNNYINNSFKYILLSILFLNVVLQHYLKLPDFDQVLNLLISYGIFDYYKNNQFESNREINILQTIFSLFLLIVTLYRSFWLHIDDNFIYLFFPLLLISLALLFNNYNHIFKNFSPILMALLFPIGKVLFIPLAFVLTPFSTVITWLSLNALGFYSVLQVPEIFYKGSGINVNFSCSGAGQIIFCITAMIIFNFCFPLKNVKFFLVQLFRSFLFTFSTNIIRLILLAIYVNTAASTSFSTFDYLHGGNGGLIFSFFSMLFSCESYKRLYFRDIQIK